MTRPFLKWAGGKGRLLKQLRPLLPPTDSFNHYYEPFVGSGALFFALRPARATLSDSNSELIDCYRAVRDQVEALIAALQTHRYEKEYYYEVRAWDPAVLELPQRAARTIFLNRTGYNGLYRVNKKGRFNVPFGRYKNPRICDAENLRACSAALKGVELLVCSFEKLHERVAPGDFVYFDPPYVPLSGTANFTSYMPGGFGQTEQEELARLFTALDGRGACLMQSNSDTPLVRRLYAAFTIDTILARRNINSNAGRRGHVREVVIRNCGSVKREA